MAKGPLVIGTYDSPQEAENAKAMAIELAKGFGRQLSITTRYQVVGARPLNGAKPAKAGRALPTEKLEPCPVCGRNDFTRGAGRDAHVRSHKGARSAKKPRQKKK